MDKIIELFKEYELFQQIGVTLLMVFIPLTIAYIIGLPLGIICVITREKGIKPNKVLNKILGVIINFGRSIPFIILICLLVPVTRFIVGTSLGPKGAMVPLTIACIPFVARIVEQSLEEVDHGVIDAAICMGATTWDICTKIYLVEAIPSLIRGLSITAITLLGYTAMAGAIGARGLGYIAIENGYKRNNMPLMWICVVIIIILVEIIQIGLEIVAKKVNKKQ